MEMRDELISRWNLDLGNISEYLDKILSGINFHKNRRGRPFKRNPITYIKLLILKEYNRYSLRKAENVLTERIDHSVIHFWEKRKDSQFIEGVVRYAAEKLDVDYKFPFLDSTKFSTWNNDAIEVHTMARISGVTLYPVSIHFGRTSPSNAVRNTLVEGNGNVLADRWYGR